MANIDTIDNKSTVELAQEFVDAFFDDENNIEKLEEMRDTVLKFAETSPKTLDDTINLDDSEYNIAQLDDSSKELVNELYDSYLSEINPSEKHNRLIEYLEAFNTVSGKQWVAIQGDQVIDSVIYLRSLASEVLDNPLTKLNLRNIDDRRQLKQIMFSEYELLKAYQPKEDMRYIGNFINGGVVSGNENETTTRIKALWKIFNPLSDTLNDSDWGYLVLSHLLRNGVSNIFDVAARNRGWHEVAHWVMEAFVIRQFEYFDYLAEKPEKTEAEQNSFERLKTLTRIQIDGKEYPLSYQMYVQGNNIAENIIYFIELWARDTLVPSFGDLPRDTNAKIQIPNDEKRARIPAEAEVESILNDMLAAWLGTDKSPKYTKKMVNELIDLTNSWPIKRLPIIQTSIEDLYEQMLTNGVRSAQTNAFSYQLNFLIKQVSKATGKSFTANLKNTSIAKKELILKDLGMSELEIKQAMTNLNDTLKYFYHNLTEFVFPWMYAKASEKTFRHSIIKSIREKQKVEQ